MRTVSILGATGSIGASTLKVLARHKERFSVAAVVGGRDARALATAAKACGARFAALADASQFSTLREALAGTGIDAGAGEAALIEAATMPCDITIAAIAGIAGLRPTHAALSKGRRIALANKECLVSAGPAFLRDAATRGAEIVPLDSEHNAIFQVLGGMRADAIEKVTITGSGGPFLRWDLAAMAKARVEDALKHPTWSMGAKITVDSATLMNKGLELIEAHYLFNLAPEMIEILVHPQSIVHGLVEFHDGSTLAMLARPSMEVAISYGLGLPERLESDAARLNLSALRQLDFEAPDHVRFPAIALARESLELGGSLPTVLNAANEYAVEAFLARRIGFAEIARIVRGALDYASVHSAAAPNSIDEAIAIDRETRMRLDRGLPKVAIAGS